MSDRRLDPFLAALATRPMLMGVINVTPDSFSDGGRFFAPDAALAQARRLAEAGADMLDVGAESTRPGHAPVSAEEEWRRLAPALAPMIEAVALPFSIDTQKAAIAARALALGVSMVNDVGGLQGDPGIAATAARAGAGVIVMHNRQRVAPEIDIVEDMLGFFERSLAIAERAGVVRGKILLDPGVGFGKTTAQNLAALAAVGRLKAAFGLPVLVGASRKRMFGELLRAPIGDRLVGTLAAHLAARARGADVFRVHDAAEHRAAFAVFEAIRNG